MFSTQFVTQKKKEVMGRQPYSLDHLWFQWAWVG